MEFLLNLVFYILGIGLPSLIILVALFKKSKHKLSNLIEKTIIAVIIFGIFYIFKLGINTYLLEGENSVPNIPYNEKVDKTTETNNNNDSLLENENIQNEHKIIEIDGVTYIDGILIVNKTYSLPEDFVPTDTYESATGMSYCSNCINKEAYQKFQEMEADATSIGLNIWIQSGYRSYSLQDTLYNNYVNADGKIAADTYSARPGHSEHQTGLAFDLNSISDDFQYTDEGMWVNQNAHKYGFIIRYPKEKEDITGYKYESWHLRYVGEEIAKILYNNGDWITLEEYLGITSKYEES